MAEQRSGVTEIWCTQRKRGEGDVYILLIQRVKWYAYKEVESTVRLNTLRTSTPAFRQERSTETEEHSLR